MHSGLCGVVAKEIHCFAQLRNRVRNDLSCLGNAQRQQLRRIPLEKIGSLVEDCCAFGCGCGIPRQLAIDRRVKGCIDVLGNFGWKCGGCANPPIASSYRPSAIARALSSASGSMGAGSSMS